MDYQELIDDLKGRINPQYVDCMGTESYERKQCLEAIESLLNALDIAEGEVKRTAAERDAALAELAKCRDAPVVAWKIAFKSANERNNVWKLSWTNPLTTE